MHTQSKIDKWTKSIIPTVLNRGRETEIYHDIFLSDNFKQTTQSDKFSSLKTFGTTCLHRARSFFMGFQHHPKRVTFSLLFHRSTCLSIYLSPPCYAASKVMCVMASCRRWPVPRWAGASPPPTRSPSSPSICCLDSLRWVLSFIVVVMATAISPTLFSRL